MESASVDRENTWLSIQETAEHLGVNPRTVRRYIKVKGLAVSRISNKVVRIRLADIDRFIEGGLPPADPVVKTPVVTQKRAPMRPAAPARPSIGKFG